MLYGAKEYLLRTLFQAELDSGLSFCKEGGLRKCNISYFLIYSDSYCKTSFGAEIRNEVVLNASAGLKPRKADALWTKICWSNNKVALYCFAGTLSSSDFVLI